MLILRPVAVGDLDDLVALAGQLDSANLPQDANFLAERIASSLRSFARDLPDARDATYVFALEDTETKRMVGTSSIIAKHGRTGSPFEGPGRSLLWDAFGARFTGLPYREADHLNARSKQFIADLFPRDPVYVTLFPEGEPIVSVECREALGVSSGDRVGVTPLP